ncbi:retrotransposon protein, putative, ty1-copia subclass [Tanacetum coccineum]|uniref:Retrotransposon protein, putative, ty1-copia subclass n=1 Tax=Tanacetum coccineum TaxID=301880 RepID=A0ABQ5GJL0_9ASTR
MKDLRNSIRENYLQQTKHIKDPWCKLQISIYGLKQASRSWNKRFDEEIKKFRFAQNLDEPCVYQKASGSNVTFLIDESRSMDEMYRVTTSFLQGEVAAFSHSRKKAPASWKQPEGGNKPNF